MNIYINRHDLCMNVISAMYTNPSICKITEDDNIVVPAERYEDFCHDMAIILALILQSISKPNIDDK